MSQRCSPLSAIHNAASCAAVAEAHRFVNRLPSMHPTQGQTPHMLATSGQTWHCMELCTVRLRSELDLPVPAVYPWARNGASSQSVRRRSVSSETFQRSGRGDALRILL